MSTLYFDPPSCPLHLCKVGDNVPQLLWWHRPWVHISAQKGRPSAEVSFCGMPKPIYSLCTDNQSNMSLHHRVLTGLFTGHATLNRHLAVMKIRTDPICSACGKEDETSVHFLGKCPGTIMARHSILGAYFLRSVELRCIQPHALMRFARASKRFK